MRKLGLLLAVVAIGVTIFTGCSYSSERLMGGNAVEKTFNISDFKSLDIGSAFDVDVIPGDYRVEIIIDEKLMDDLLVQKNGDTLKIGLGSKWRFSFLEGPKILKARIYMPVIENVNVSGAASMNIGDEMQYADTASFDLSGASHVKADYIAFDISGAGRFEGSIEVDSLDAYISGASDMNVSGNAHKVRMDLSGASRFGQREFAADTVSIQASGASSVRMQVKDEARLDASGASSIDIEGSPQVLSEQSSGASTIKIK